MRIKKYRWAIPYLAVAVIHIAIISLGLQGGAVTKPLLMPLLLFYFAVETGIRSAASRLITAALICSWLGDLFLMFKGYFIPGLVSFFFAHIFYIIHNQQLTGRGIIRQQPWTALPVLLYLVGILSYLLPHLGPLKIPVIIYASMICLFLLSALNLRSKIHPAAARLLVLGATLFVISDSILAINRFKPSVSIFPPSVMITYCTAQYLIVSAYINHQKING